MATATPIEEDPLVAFDTQGHVGNEVELAMRTLYKADAVCFDVDSTVIAEEGIDVLAEYLGKGEGERVIGLARAMLYVQRFVANKNIYI